MHPVPGPPSDDGGIGLLARTLADAVVALDAEGVVVFADARAADLVGSDPAGAPFAALFADEARPLPRDAEGRIASGVWDAPLGDGGWLNVACHALDAEGGPWPGGAVVLLRPVAGDGAADRTDLFRRAFDAANNLIVVTDPRAPDDPVVLVNGHFLQATGYTREEVIGRNCRFLQTRADGTRDDDQDGLREIRRALAAGEPTRVVLRNYRKSGELFYNELYLSPVRDAEGRLVNVVGVQNDVTDRVLAARAAAEQAEMVGSFFRGMPLPMGVLERTDAGVRHRAANAAAAALFGRPAEAVVGADLADLGVPPPEVERWAAAIDRAGEAPATFETTHPWGEVGDDARTFRVTVSRVAGGGGLYAYVGEDVTRARRTEAERRLLSAAVVSAAEAIVVTDADLDDGPHILYANAAHLGIFGYQAHEIVGRTPRIYQGPQTERAVLDRIRAALEAGETVRAQAINYRKDGTPFHLEWEIAPVRDGDGRVVQFVGTQRDVTERRRLEREVLDISAHERERMARDLHDGLGQVLTGAGLHIEALANTLAQEGQAARAAEARQAGALVTRALHDARATARGLIPVVSDRDGLAVALGRLAAEVTETHGVRCAFRAPGPVRARTVEHAGHLLRIAQEAVTNATRHGRARSIEISLEADGTAATLTVADDGSGIPPDALDRAGGLGLRSMRYRATSVGGVFRVGPRPAGGTEVVVEFPAEAAVPA